MNHKEQPTDAIIGKQELANIPDATDTVDSKYEEVKSIYRDVVWHREKKVYLDIYYKAHDGSTLKVTYNRTGAVPVLIEDEEQLADGTHIEKEYYEYNGEYFVTDIRQYNSVGIATAYSFDLEVHDKKLYKRLRHSRIENNVHAKSVSNPYAVDASIDWTSTHTQDETVCETTLYEKLGDTTIEIFQKNKLKKSSSIEEWTQPQMETKLHTEIKVQTYTRDGTFESRSTWNIIYNLDGSKAISYRYSSAEQPQPRFTDVTINADGTSDRDIAKLIEEGRYLIPPDITLDYDELMSKIETGQKIAFVPEQNPSTEPRGMLPS